MTRTAVATMLDAALDYARRGWPVFPCDSPGKTPKIKDWPNQATTDPATIRQWWTRWPHANIGIPTGERSGFFVLDVDPRHGGDDTLRDLEAQHGALPATVEAQTGGGGQHILFRCPGYPVKSGSGVLGPGLDIKGDGGYIVAPQSLHESGRHYVFEASSHPDDVAIAKAPAWLLDKLRPEATNGNGFTVGEKIKDGTRNDTLYRLARSEKARGLSPKASLAALRVMNAERCEPPLPDAEIEKIVSNAFKQPDRPEFTATGATETQSQPEDVVIIRLADVQPEPVTWLWPRRIPLGKLTVLDGDPGLGKSTLAFDVAARVSNGSAMPDGSPSLPGGAVILTLEDGLADTVVPRLKVAGADLEKIVALQGVKGVDGKLRVPTVEDLTALTCACKQVEAKLVIIDPLMGYLPSQRNSWRDQDVRQALAPLTKMAEDLGVAVLVIRHLNKSGGSQSIYRGGGSIGIVGAARMALLVAKDPENEERRILAGIKTNLSRMPESLAFRVEAIDDTARIVWDGASSHTADALLAAPVSQEERSV
ncbi:MAG: bifunctional DNA primase/polymerase, partial [candidate division NC10 bacterium]|nr:bifunctional DNA primase/polymerase [candidate division NC10 bacterium]